MCGASICMHIHVNVCVCVQVTMCVFKCECICVKCTYKSSMHLRPVARPVARYVKMHSEVELYVCVRERESQAHECHPLCPWTGFRSRYLLALPCHSTCATTLSLYCSKYSAAYPSRLAWICAWLIYRVGQFWAH